jgi:FolB domain-containing protein
MVKKAQSNTTPDSGLVYTNCLTINKIRLSVKLGCEKEERKNPQAVDVDIKFFFPALTTANLKDKGEFLCYDKISNKIKDVCEKREFRLIEYLGTEIYHMIRKDINPDIKIVTKVTKIGLPVAFILGGASFLYTDLPPFSWVVAE